MKKIAKFEHDGNIDLRRVMHLNYEDTREEMLVEHGVELPPFARIEDPGDLRVLLAPFTLTVHFDDSDWWQWKLLPGYITDLASVPKCLRSAVDNDEYSMLVPALIHDANFSRHCVSFREANSLFRTMIRSYGGGSLKAFLAWVAVSSCVGRSRWKHQDSVDRANAQTVRFMGGEQ